jgi:hypothetical protein
MLTNAANAQTVRKHLLESVILEFPEVSHIRVDVVPDAAVSTSFTTAK